MIRSAPLLSAAAAVVALLALPRAAFGFLPASAPKAAALVGASSSSASAASVRVWSSSPDTITSPFESGVKVRKGPRRETKMKGAEARFVRACRMRLCPRTEVEVDSTPTPQWCIDQTDQSRCTIRAHRTCFTHPQFEQQSGSDDGPLPLTLENVELVLDEMRPYLMSDGCVTGIKGNACVGLNDWGGGLVDGALLACPSTIVLPVDIGVHTSQLSSYPNKSLPPPPRTHSGNVVVSDIDGPVVKLELQGACGSCPSSTMTMKMGLERRLKEKIPEISEVRCRSLLLA